MRHWLFKGDCPLRVWICFQSSAFCTLLSRMWTQATLKQHMNQSSIPSTGHAVPHTGCMDDCQQRTFRGETRSGVRDSKPVRQALSPQTWTK